jgi:hypothetical protein
VLYLEGLEQGRLQGVVYGDVRRRCVDSEGRPQLCALREVLNVVGVGAGPPMTVTTAGPYQLVLQPGAVEIWVERNGERLATEVWVEEKPGTGRRLSPSERFSVRNGDEQRVLLSVAVE